jgi:hypothetical protein
MAEKPRSASFLPLVPAARPAEHRRMTIYVLLTWMVAMALLAPRFGADSRCGGPCR